MIRNTIVGIDVGTYTTRVVVSEREKSTDELQVIGTGMSPTTGLRHGYVIDSGHASLAIKKAVREAEKNANTPIKRAIISIGGISLGSDIGVGTAIISKSDTEVTSLDIEKAMRECEKDINLSNKRIIYTSPLAFKLDGKEVLGRPEGMKGVKLEMRTLFVTCLASHLDDLEATVLEAGIEVIDIVPSPIAASSIALTERQKTVGCALVNIGAETVSLAVFENNILIGLHVFSIGSTDITNDIALGLKIPLDEAETIKIGGSIGSYPKKKLDEIIEARLSDIFELIESYLKKIKRNGLLPAGIILSGGGSNLAIIEELSKALLRLPTKVAGNEISTAQKSKLRDSTWFHARSNYSHQSNSVGDFTKKSKAFLSKWFEQFRP